ncbi:MAG: lyase family protein [Candidatus Diapherotrites archaeon]|nr:lyase family protein [Candidatus Diapherotrites archaeon]
MTDMDLFDSISPLDYRYYGRDAKIFGTLQPYLSENARIRYQAKVEAAFVQALAQRHICSSKIADEITHACSKVTTEEVYAEEDRIRHDVRALVNCITRRVSDDAKPFVHLGLTSFDVIDTANALRYKQFIQNVLVPALMELEETLMKMALAEKDTVQIGRTHGQHAEPITFGLFVAGYVSRLGSRIEAIQDASDKLAGKCSGAVGAYNALSMLMADPLQLEADVMQRLGLLSSVSSTQIVEPEPLTDLSHALVSTMGVFANLSDDFRNLQRSEIGEVQEAFGSQQVGSSTMPHKRNPWNFENVKSFWKAFMPRMTTAYMDQVSEHQRDLTNSASSRFWPETLGGLYITCSRLTKILPSVTVDHARMNENLAQSAGLVIAEPLYILLASMGHSDAHETARRLSMAAHDAGTSVLAQAQQDPFLAPYLSRWTPQQRAVLSDPRNYTGRATEKTERIVREWTQKLKMNPAEKRV